MSTTSRSILTRVGNAAPLALLAALVCLSRNQTPSISAPRSSNAPAHSIRLKRLVLTGGSTCQAYVFGLFRGRDGGRCAGTLASGADGKVACGRLAFAMMS
jgi:hypothetical protein